MLLDDRTAPAEGESKPLEAARACYLGLLRSASRTLDDQVADLARACADLFAFDLRAVPST
jgi:hypothetical protein